MSEFSIVFNKDKEDQEAFYSDDPITFLSTQIEPLTDAIKTITVTRLPDPDPVWLMAHCEKQSLARIATRLYAPTQMNYDERRDLAKILDGILRNLVEDK